ncbi:MAG: S-layer homology domain-containing protein [Clostridia bacterium]|nr:S-layer homology domain-containing protein [Clostridia bacterium]
MNRKKILNQLLSGAIILSMLGSGFPAALAEDGSPAAENEISADTGSADIMQSEKESENVTGEEIQLTEPEGAELFAAAGSDKFEVLPGDTAPETKTNYENRKVTFDLDAYDFTDPSKLERPVPMFLTDEQLFGKWDSGKGTYTVEGKLDYSYESPYRYNLSAVEDAVKKGDYELAKAELLQYYRNVTRAMGMPSASSNKSQRLTANLLLQGFHYNGNSGQSAADMFTVNSSSYSWTEADVLNVVESYRNSATKKLPLYVYAVNKDNYEAEFLSKEGDASYAPYLEVVAGGSTIKIPVYADTYVSAGDNAGRNYGREKTLLASEHVGGWANPVTSNTKQIYLMFDLSAIREGTPVTSAKLKMYGRWVDKQAKPRNNSSYKKTMVILCNGNDWNEDTVNFVTVPHPALSYDGQYGLDWIFPLNAVVNGASQSTWHVRINQEMLRFSSWWNVLTNEYLATGDEDYARCAMMYLDDFIKETFYVYMGMPGGEYDGWIAKDYSVGGQKPSKTVFTSNWKRYEDQGMQAYGGYSETLDASTRLSCLSSNLKSIYFSEYMTPEIFTTFIKYMWSMGDWAYKNWSSSEAGGNWGTSQCKAAYSLMANFPEFADINRVQSFTAYTNYKPYNGKVRTGSWMDMMWANLKQVALDNVVHSDGSSGELSLSYTDYALSTITGIKGIADSLDIDVEYSDELKKGIVELVTYIVNQSLPGFYDNQMGDGGTYTRSYKEARIKPIADWLQDPFLLWAAYDGKKGKAPDYTSKYYDVGKTMTMRSDWSKDALYLHVDADGGSGTHAHWDDLAVIVSAYGDYLLTDPLYYVQTTNDPARRFLVSSRGHNTMEINDYCQSGINPTNVESAMPKGGGQGTFEKVEFNDSYDFTTIYGGPNFKNLKYIKKNGDTSFERDNLPTATEPGMDYKRNILFVKPNFWIVSDYMNPVDKNKVNKYTQLWHMRPESDMKIDGQYVLKEGEKVGEVNGVPDDIDPTTVFKKNMQISNTQYVPGTGTGAFYSSNPKGANIMVVPADVSSVTPKLMYGVYHPNLLVPYGVFEKNVKGTSNMDTILFPTKSGETYSVVPEPLSVDMPAGAASAFKSSIKDESGVSNTEYDFSYYILHEKDKQKKIEFGECETDGTLAYYETDTAGAPRRVIVQDTKSFTDKKLNTPVIYSKASVSDLSVEWVGSELHLDTSADISLDGITILSPKNALRVTLNGESVSFKQHNNYVYFGSEPVIEGTPIEKPSQPGSSGTSGGSTGGGSGHGSGGTAGGNAAGSYVPGGSTAGNSFDAELKGHWAEAEIKELIEKGIVNGSDGSLKLKNNITRAEFLALVMRAMSIEPASYGGAFTDVNENDWYAGYMQSASDLKIIEGYDGKASPNDNITREQAIKIMITALQTKQEIDLSGEIAGFDDIAEISGWARPYCAAAVGLGLITGSDNKIMPADAALREQAMVMVYRIMNRE